MKTLEILRSERLAEAVQLATTPSGVRVAVLQKPGFSTAAGYFGLRFGSTHTRFRSPEGEAVEVPDGSAHFLEHKLFEGREEKVFDRFGRLGARFNGGTSFRTTTYYFVSAGRFEECLEVLLDFVQHPLITEERVEKEKGIIEQEVRMYEDEPGYRGFFLLHRALFHEHPIRIPPGGTVESVRRTHAVDLQRCYDGFYRPQNLMLSLAGDLDPEAVLARVESLLDSPRPGHAEPEPVTEPETVAEPWLEERFTVARPRVWIGWRDRTGVGLGEPMLRRRTLSSLALDLALDHSSHLHEDLYRRQVIDDSFGTSYSDDADYGYAVASGQTDDPEGFVREVRAALARFVEEGPREEDLERVRRASWGWIVSQLQTPAALASSTLHSMLDAQRPFAMLDVLEDVTLDELTERARELLDPGRSAVAVLRPAD